MHEFEHQNGLKCMILGLLCASIHHIQKTFRILGFLSQMSLLHGPLYFCLLCDRLEHGSHVMNSEEICRKMFLKYLHFEKHKVYPNFNFNSSLREVNFVSLRKKKEISVGTEEIKADLDSVSLLDHSNHNSCRLFS